MIARQPSRIVRAYTVLQDGGWWARVTAEKLLRGSDGRLRPDLSRTYYRYALYDKTGARVPDFGDETFLALFLADKLKSNRLRKSKRRWYSVDITLPETHVEADDEENA